MNDNLEPAGDIHQVPPTETDSLTGLQTQINNLQGMVLALENDRLELGSLKQELRNAAELMQRGVVEFRELRTRIRKLETKGET